MNNYVLHMFEMSVTDLLISNTFHIYVTIIALTVLISPVLIISFLLF